ncbi:hypothetical protein HPB48_026540 [Haemaphysalis longicornis]|uniref:Partial AB-hydrolase lipase domain-containing protein n=1 Tax=Haemaphysalis longicornis TaxID=44386 RepID=A0A9J6HB04_HAELO|nr:hypothetical protein HPB48_026540 [Haemaphysalis longicornis]
MPFNSKSAEGHIIYFFILSWGKQTEIIADKGYPVEEHAVVTKDGYILYIQRIPYGRKGRGQRRRPVAFLQHGLVDASVDWVINYPQQSLDSLVQAASEDGNVQEVSNHIAYIAAYHNWTQTETQRLDAALRRAYREALGLYRCARTDRLDALGVHNTIAEIAEAQRVNQLHRLSNTLTGRYMLDRAGLRPIRALPPEVESLPSSFARRLSVAPLPKNMHPGIHDARRQARARALDKLYTNDTGARYVDAAAYQTRPGWFAAAVVTATSGTIATAASFRADTPAQAEEMAIALAATDPHCTAILSDSKTAIRNFGANTITSPTARLLTNTTTPSSPVHLIWFPAHLDHALTRDRAHNRDVDEDRAARDLTSQASPRARSPRPLIGPGSELLDPSETRLESPTPLEDYGSILRWHRDCRRRLPAPHPRLTRSEGVLLHQIQTDSVLTPVLGQHVAPEVYPSAVCAVCCAARGTLAHILQCFPQDPAPSSLR